MVLGNLPRSQWCWVRLTEKWMVLGETYQEVNGVGVRLTEKSMVFGETY